MTIERATQFLIKRQTPEGAWWDFRLGPGTSDAWVTAYVGRCLRATSAKSMRSLERAATWLLAQLRFGEGWGYNASLPIDSDSTANAVLFLRAMGLHVSEKCYARLRQFQRFDSGFATYDAEQPNDAWSISHPDVSAVVVAALCTRHKLGDALIARGIDYVRAHLHSTGFAQSYWWTTPFYATAVAVSLLESVGVPYRREQVVKAVCTLACPTGAFELALKGEILFLLAPDHPELVVAKTTLEDEQLEDGSWAPSARLRVTDRWRTCPWMSTGSAGQIVEDCNRVFTTATVLQFLSHLESRRTSALLQRDLHMRRGRGKRRLPISKQGRTR